MFRSSKFLDISEEGVSIQYNLLLNQARLSCQPLFVSHAPRYPLELAPGELFQVPLPLLVLTSLEQQPVWGGWGGVGRKRI